MFYVIYRYSRDASGNRILLARFRCERRGSGKEDVARFSSSKGRRPSGGYQEAISRRRRERFGSCGRARFLNARSLESGSCLCVCVEGLLWMCVCVCYLSFEY